MTSPEPSDISADYVRGSLFPIATPPAKILYALVVACKEALQGTVHVYVAPGYDEVRPFWQFRCIFSQDGTLVAHFRVTIQITPDRDHFLLTTTKMTIPENDLSEEEYEGYMTQVRILTMQFLGSESDLLDGPSTFVLSSQCSLSLSPDKVDWSYSPSEDWQ